MALKKNEEALFRSLSQGAKALAKFVKDADAIQAEFKEQIQELEKEAQVVLRFQFVGEELQVIIEDRSQDKVNTSFNTTNEKLLLRAQLNGVPIDVLLFKKTKKDAVPTLNLSNEQVANALLELSELVRHMPVSMVSAGNAKWGLNLGDAPIDSQADRDTDAMSEDDNGADDDNQSNETLQPEVAAGIAVTADQTAAHSGEDVVLAGGQTVADTVSTEPAAESHTQFDALSHQANKEPEDMLS